MTTEELLELKEKIEKSKTQVSELEGRKKQLFSDLEKNWKCKTLKEAEKKVESMQEEINEMNEDIQEKTNALEEQLDEQNTGDQK